MGDPAILAKQGGFANVCFGQLDCPRWTIELSKWDNGIVQVGQMLCPGWTIGLSKWDNSIVPNGQEGCLPVGSHTLCWLLDLSFWTHSPCLAAHLWLWWMCLESSLLLPFCSKLNSSLSTCCIVGVFQIHCLPFLAHDVGH